MKHRTCILAIASTLTLGACGGGGGSAGSTGGSTPVQTSALTPITAANSKQAAATGYTSADLIGNSSSSIIDVLTGVSIGGGRISAVSPVLTLARRVVGQDPQLLTGVTTSEACSGGGSVAIDANLHNAQTFSNGDILTLTAKNCVEDGNNLNGVLTMTLSEVSGDLVNSWVGTVTMDTRFTGFSIASGSETATVNGDMKIAFRSTSTTSNAITISGKSLQTTEQKAGATVANLTLSDYSLTGSTEGTTTTSAASLTLAGNANGLGQFAYTVKNIQPFVSNGTAMPGSGSLIVNGAASSVTVTALNASSVRLDYSTKGDGTITQSVTLSWSEFLASI